MADGVNIPHKYTMRILYLSMTKLASQNDESHVYHSFGMTAAALTVSRLVDVGSNDYLFIREWERTRKKHMEKSNQWLYFVGQMEPGTGD